MVRSDVSNFHQIVIEIIGCKENFVYQNEIACDSKYFGVWELVLKSFSNEKYLKNEFFVKLLNLGKLVKAKKKKCIL